MPTKMGDAIASFPTTLSVRIQAGKPNTRTTQCDISANITAGHENPEDVSDHVSCGGADPSILSCLRVEESQVPGIKQETGIEELNSGEITTVTDEKYNTDNSWQIYKDGKPIGHIVDVSNSDTASWMTEMTYQSSSTIVQPTEPLLAVPSNVSTAEKPFMCPTCGSSFKNNCHLKRHVMSHDKPLKCSMCEYKCSQQYHLIEHIRTHTGEKPFRCSVCEFKCSRQFVLTTHMKTHTGEKPFKCSMCEYRCTLRHHLTDHMRTHSGEKPFKCTLCKYSCAWRGDLKRHIKTHFRVKPLKCSLCEYRCGSKNTLRRHVKMHKDV